MSYYVVPLPRPENTTPEILSETCEKSSYQGSGCWSHMQRALPNTDRRYTRGHLCQLLLGILSFDIIVLQNGWVSKYFKLHGTGVDDTSILQTLEVGENPPFPIPGPVFTPKPSPQATFQNLQKIHKHLETQDGHRLLIYTNDPKQGLTLKICASQSFLRVDGGPMMGPHLVGKITVLRFAA